MAALMSAERSLEVFRASRSSIPRMAFRLRPLASRIAPSSRLSKAQPSFRSAICWRSLSLSPLSLSTSMPSNALSFSCTVASWPVAVSSCFWMASALAFSRLMSAPFSSISHFRASSVMPGMWFFTSSRFMMCPFSLRPFNAMPGARWKKADKNTKSRLVQRLFNRGKWKMGKTKARCGFASCFVLTLQTGW